MRFFEAFRFLLQMRTKVVQNNIMIRMLINNKKEALNDKK